MRGGVRIVTPTFEGPKIEERRNCAKTSGKLDLRDLSDLGDRNQPEDVEEAMRAVTRVAEQKVPNVREEEPPQSGRDRLTLKKGIRNCGGANARGWGDTEGRLRLPSWAKTLGGPGTRLRAWLQHFLTWFPTVGYLAGPAVCPTSPDSAPSASVAGLLDLGMERLLE